MAWPVWCLLQMEAKLKFDSKMMLVLRYGLEKICFQKSIPHFFFIKLPRIFFLKVMIILGPSTFLLTWPFCKKLFNKGISPAMFNNYYICFFYIATDSLTNHILTDAIEPCRPKECKVKSCQSSSRQGMEPRPHPYIAILAESDQAILIIFDCYLLIDIESFIVPLLKFL